MSKYVADLAVEIVVLVIGWLVCAISVTDLRADFPLDL